MASRKSSSIFLVLLGLLPFTQKLYNALAEPLVSQLPNGQTMIATNPAGAFFAPLKLTFFVALFAKNVNNMKNGAKLSAMQTKLKALPVEFGNIALQPYTFTPNGDIPSDAGYHTRVFYINAFIKTA